jgi:hypothetical protein
MRSIETWGGLKQAVPLAAILGAFSVTACQAETTDPVSGHQSSPAQSPSFDCVRGNYFKSPGTNGYVRVKALRDGSPFELESVKLTVPGTTYNVTIGIDDDGRAVLPAGRPLPLNTGELSIWGVTGEESDLCSTDYHPLSTYVPPKPDTSTR